MRKVFLLIGTLFLSGCLVGEKAESGISGFEEYRNNLLMYSIEMPERAFIPNKSPDKDQIFFGNISQIKENTPDAISILLLGRDPAECTSFALGVSELNERMIDGVKAWSGLVDAYDAGILYSYAGAEYPPCEPPGLKFAEKKPDDYGDGMTRIDNSAAYALCSEKDGKRIVVCVQQMTDNPELAEEIFSTFRWLE